MNEIYPLKWPEGWDRTAVSARRRAAYKTTPADSRDGLVYELGRLGAREVVFSSNLKRWTHEAPKHVLDDPGFSVWWVQDGFGERVIACDKWDRLYNNIHAVALAVSALRAIQRSGASQIFEKAFSAFGALPPAPEAKARRPWWEVLGLTQEALSVVSYAMVDARYRELVKKYHPDAPGNFGGDPMALQELTESMDEAKAHFQAP